MTPPPFVSPQELADYTQGKVDPTDARVVRLLVGASAAIRRRCGWHVFPSVTETLRLDGPGGRELSLPTMNLTALGDVLDRDVAVDATDLEWSRLGTVRRRSGWWSESYGALAVTMTHGYEEVPDLAQVVSQVVAAALSSPMGATKEQAGSLAVTWATTAPGVAGGLSLLERDLAVVDAYRLRDA